MRQAIRSGGRWIAVALVGCIVLAGCGAGGGESAEQADTPVSAPGSPPVALAGVGDIVWATSVNPATQAPLDPLTALPNDALQVIAALPVETLPAGTVVRAHWTIDGEPLPALDPDPLTVEEGLAGAWLTWTLRWEGEQPWPIGRLGIVVEIDGAANWHGDIPIVRPNA